MPQSVIQKLVIVISENLDGNVQDAPKITKIKKPLVARWVFDEDLRPYCKWVSE